MPNWVPDIEHKEQFEKAVAHVMSRRVHMMEDNFPLNLEQLKAITRPPEFQAMLAMKDDYGDTTASRTTWLCFELGQEYLPRRVIVHVQLASSRNNLFYPFSNQLRQHFKANERIYFNHEALEPEVLARLVKWTTDALYERRLAKLTALTVHDFLHHTEDLSLYHIVARWPALKVMFSRCADVRVAYRRARHNDIWERRGKAVGRALGRWEWPLRGPDADWYDANRRKMRLCEEALLSAVTLGPPPTVEKPIEANIADWEVFQGQPL